MSEDYPNHHSDDQRHQHGRPLMQPTTTTSTSLNTRRNHIAARREARDYSDRQDYARTTHYAREWSQWMQDGMTSDTTGAYFPCILNHLHLPITPTQDSASVRRRLLTQLCESLSVRLHPSFSRSNAKRNDPHQSVGLIVLPATKDAQTHLHGWIRVPTTDTGRTHVCIQEHGTPRVITAPQTLEWFVDECRIRLHTANIWIANDGTTARTELETGCALLDYVSRPRKGTEVRHWDAVEFMPSYLFLRLRGGA